MAVTLGDRCVLLGTVRLWHIWFVRFFGLEVVRSGDLLGLRLCYLVEEHRTPATVVL